MDPKDKQQQPPDPIQQAREKLTALVAEQEQIINTVTAQGRQINEEENAKLKELEAAQAALGEDIARRIAAAEAQANLSKPLPRVVQPMDATPPPRQGATTATAHVQPITGRDVGAESGTFAFESPSAWFKAIALARNGIIDRRLTAAMAAQTSFANEGTGPEGGWAMPPDFSNNIVEAVAGQASLLGRMRPMQSNSNTYVSPVDESTGWGTAGIQAAKTAEGAASTASVWALQGRTVTLYKATSLVNVTEELSTDNPASVQHITRIMGRQLQGIVERWLLRGTGVAEPMGILTAPALVSVAAESTGNGAGTLIRKNLAKCAGRLIPGFDAETFWVVSPSAKIEVLDLMLTAGGNTGADIQRGFGPTLLGFPVVTSMEAAAVGTVGDATAVVPSGFMTLVKGGVQSAATIYFAFDQGLTTLRAYVRIGQVPILSAAVTPKVDTATTLSHCVTTATRS